MLNRFFRSQAQKKWYSTYSQHPPYPCGWVKEPNDIRNVLCDGPILRAVQNSRVFPDCKTFVDMNIKSTVPTILSDWKVIEDQYGTAIPMTAILEFLNKNFETVEGDSQLEKWVPSDWKPNPTIIEKVTAPEYKYLAKELNSLWLKLARKMSPQIKSDSGKTTLIYVPHGFIIPGGRFRELYYWDTYFILLGLIACDMFETAKGLVSNMLHLVETYGSIFNGTRIYYQFRSQPPLFLKMVDEYVNSTKDFDFVRKNFKSIEREIVFWENSRKIEVNIGGKKYDVFRYFCCTPGPRPESYREDVATASEHVTDESRIYKYQAIASACESGWDFSSRWFKCKKGNTIVDLHTQEIVPVDLNSYMHMNYEILTKWATELKLDGEMSKYATRSENLKRAIHDLLWNEDDGIWYDRNLKDGSFNKIYAASNFTPLWTKSFSSEAKMEIAEKMLMYYSKFNLWKFKGGVPTTMCFSGEQWDWPNAWPPLQLIVSQGFRNVGLPVVAFRIANNWVNNNYSGYIKHKVIFEKYDCRRPGMTGFGGEYEEQVGFGWSNGVLFNFMNDYGDKLRPFPVTEEKKPFYSTRELTRVEEDSLM